ncbi:hypothetical protein MN608_08872 [Microdochium nivale]|nr:hypothetical protein MN608_08872 [Microdochium nivale]
MSGPFFVGDVQVAIPPPEGYVVNFDHPQRNLAVDAYWHFGIGNAFAFLAIAQRIYVRLWIQKRVFLEDAFLGAAYIISVISQSLAIRDVARGVFGTHSWEMPIGKFFLLAIALYLLPILFTALHCCAKMSLLLVYNRLTPELWFRYPVWITMVVVVVYTLILLFMFIFPCQPVAAAWDLTITGAVCLDRHAIYMASSIMGAVTDLMVLAVPMPLLWNLQRPRRQKIGLAAIFGMGILTAFTAFMRLKWTIGSLGVVDLSWSASEVMLWFFAESNLSVIISSLLTAKIFISSVAPSLLGSTSGGSRNTPGRRPSISNPPELVTFGGSGGGGRDSSRKTAARRDKYERFGDEGTYPLTTLVDIREGSDEHKRSGSSASQPADHNSDYAFEGSLNDAESTRDIVAPTKDTTVTTNTMVASSQNR